MPATPITLDEILLASERPDYRERLAALAAQTSVPEALMSTAELQEMETPAFLLEDILVQGGQTVLFGPPKTGKTFLAVDWAYALSCGQAWLGLKEGPPVPLRVLYCAAEGIRGLKNRTLAYEEYYPERAQTTNLRWLSGSRYLYHKDRRNPPADFLELIAVLEEFQPHVVIFDTLFKHTPGSNINDNADMNTVDAILTDMRLAYGHTQLIVHHSKKSGDDYLGAQVVKAGADMIVEMRQNGVELEVYFEGREIEDSKLDYSLRFAPIGNSVVLEKGGIAGANIADSVMTLLSTYSDEVRTAQEIAEELDANLGSVKNALTTLYKDTLIKKGAPQGQTHTYQAKE